MFYTKYEELCKAKGVSPSKAADEMNINRASVTQWKNTPDIVPSGAILLKVSKYFNVSVDYLLGNETDFKSQTESVISDDDIKFALWGDVADEIPNDKLQEVKTFAEFIKNTYKKDDNK